LIVKTAIVLSATSDEKPEGPEIGSQLLSGYLKFIVRYSVLSNVVDADPVDPILMGLLVAFSTGLF
jgi:hypothetical protein